jgi:hypothetical protein
MGVRVDSRSKSTRIRNFSDRSETPFDAEEPRWLSSSDVTAALYWLLPRLSIQRACTGFRPAESSPEKR